MIVLDIDMDYFLKNISKKNYERLDENFPEKWAKEEIIKFLENNLGLNRNNRIPGFIVTHHHDAMKKWKFLIDNNKLSIPFEIVHIDSHSDLWGNNRQEYYNQMNSLKKIFQLRELIAFKNNYINEGNYLLFAIWFNWIDKITYCANPAYDLPDIHNCIFKENTEFYGDKNDENLTIQLSPNEKEVNFRFLKELDSMRNFGKYDYIIFSKSPDYTPKSLDFAIEIIKDYIDAIN